MGRLVVGVFAFHIRNVHIFPCIHSSSNIPSLFQKGDMKTAWNFCRVCGSLEKPRHLWGRMTILPSRGVRYRPFDLDPLKKGQTWGRETRLDFGGVEVFSGTNMDQKMVQLSRGFFRKTFSLSWNMGFTKTCKIDNDVFSTWRIIFQLLWTECCFKPCGVIVNPPRW